MTQQADGQSIETEAQSLEDARRKLRNMVPDGMRILKENILSDGNPLTLKGVADTEGAAFEDCRQRLPKGANVVTKKVLVKPGSRNITVPADDSDNAQEIAQQKSGDSAVVRNVTLKRAERKGFLGIGRRSASYEVEVWQPAVAQVMAIRESAKIRAHLGPKLKGVELTITVNETFMSMHNYLHNHPNPQPYVTALLIRKLSENPEEIPQRVRELLTDMAFSLKRLRSRPAAKGVTLTYTLDFSPKT